MNCLRQRLSRVILSCVLKFCCRTVVADKACFLFASMLPVLLLNLFYSLVSLRLGQNTHILKKLCTHIDANVTIQRLGLCHKYAILVLLTTFLILATQ